jgi:hypothetical protein
MLHHPYNAFDKFEEISQLVKATHLKIQDPKFDHEVNRIKHEEGNPSQAEWLTKSKNLLQEIVDLVPKHDHGLLTKDKTFTIPDFSEENQMLEWAGVGFADDDVFVISKSIKRLAILSGADRLRLMGKIYGSQKDYWIACGMLSQSEEDESDVMVEKRGEGANSLVYWVTDNLL